jgi:Sulfotransferase family
VVWGHARALAGGGPRPLELCARHWVRELEVFDQGLAVIPEARRLEIRYEAVVAEPLATMRRLGEFTGAGCPTGLDTGTGDAAVPEPERGLVVAARPRGPWSD